MTTQEKEEPEVPQTHWVQTVIVEDHGHEVDKTIISARIESAYRGLNRQALEHGMVIVSVTQFCNVVPRCDSTGPLPGMRLCYLITAQVVKREVLEQQQRMAALSGPRRGGVA